MSRHWKEPYTEATAESLGIHGFEGAPIVGDPNAKWIYYVRVCEFTFGFFSIEMVSEYLDFYSRKILPTSRISEASPFSHGPAASVGDGQSKFERLPGYLRRESNRLKVKKALEMALKEFEEESK